MAETNTRRRGRGEDAIYFATAKNRYVGSVSLSYGPATQLAREAGVAGRADREFLDAEQSPDGIQRGSDMHVGVRVPADYAFLIDPGFSVGKRNRSTSSGRPPRHQVDSHRASPPAAWPPFTA